MTRYTWSNILLKTEVILNVAHVFAIVTHLSNVIKVVPVIGCNGVIRKCIYFKWANEISNFKSIFQ